MRTRTRLHVLAFWRRCQGIRYAIHAPVRVLVHFAQNWVFMFRAMQNTFIRDWDTSVSAIFFALRHVSAGAASGIINFPEFQTFHVSSASACCVDTNTWRLNARLIFGWNIFFLSCFCSFLFQYVEVSSAQWARLLRKIEAFDGKIIVLIIIFQKKVGNRWTRMKRYTSRWMTEDGIHKWKTDNKRTTSD